MKYLFAILLVILIVVLYNNNKLTKHHEWRCVDKNNGSVVDVSMGYNHTHPHGCGCQKCLAPEQKAMNEHHEYFAAQDPAEVKRDIGGCDDNFTYAVNAFGAPDMEYKDWVASQSVDPQVIANHADFVKDRLGENGQNITGRTYSPDSHQADQSNWQGLRRPMAVAINNPTQLPDMDYSWFDTAPKFTWKSS